MLRLASIAALLGSLLLAGCASSTTSPPASPGIAASIPSSEIRPKKPLPIQWIEGDLVPSSMQECRDAEMRLESVRATSNETIFLGTLVNRANEPRKLHRWALPATISIHANGSMHAHEFVRAPDQPLCIYREGPPDPWILAPHEELPLHYTLPTILVDSETKSRPPAGVYRARWEILYSVRDIEYEDFVKVCAPDDNVVTVWIDAEKAATADAPK